MGVGIVESVWGMSERENNVINHDLGNNIVHNPGYDFDLGYKNKSIFFISWFHSLGL